MILENYLTSIQESYLLSDKTISVDLNKFESGEFDKLLVIGFIGSGKTTLANHLAKKYNVKSLHTDNCISWTIEEHPPNDSQVDKYFNCMKGLLKQNNKAVIEGVGLINLLKHKKDYLKYPMIIIGKSAIISSYQSILRNKKNKEVKFWKLLSVHAKMNITRLNKQIEYVKKERIKNPGSIVKEYKIPKL